MALLEGKTRKQRWQKSTLKHKQLLLHPSELDTKRLQRWLELGLWQLCEHRRAHSPCSLPAAMDGATASLEKASREGWKHWDTRAGSAGALGTRDVLGQGRNQLPNTGIVWNCGIRTGKGQPQALSLSPQQWWGAVEAPETLMVLSLPSWRPVWTSPG